MNLSVHSFLVFDSKVLRPEKRKLLESASNKSAALNKYDIVYSHAVRSDD